MVAISSLLRAPRPRQTLAGREVAVVSSLRILWNPSAENGRKEEGRRGEESAAVRSELFMNNEGG
jgi:hypothetical protein